MDGPPDPQLASNRPSSSVSLRLHTSVVYVHTSSRSGGKTFVHTQSVLAPHPHRTAPPPAQWHKIIHSWHSHPFSAFVYRLLLRWSLASGKPSRRMLSRRGDSSPSRSSSADAAAAPEGEHRKGATRDRGDVESGREAREEESGAAALSFPPLVRSGGERARRRRPRHVSAFRERILEERRARKEV